MTTDLRKKFWRVKQKADQNLGRAEKSEVLTDELQDLEKWVDQVKAQCHGTSKLIQRGLQTSASTEREKKLKKLSEYQLSAQLMEASGQLMQLRESTLMGQLMHTCGEAQERLAGECMEYERRVETEVLAPLNQLCDQDIPQIQKSKKNLCKMVLDMDTLKSRYAAAQKQYSAGNLPASKVEAARDELEDAQGKVHAAIDQLSTDLYKFTASEQEYSKFLLNLAKAQADYHRKALSILEGILPRMHEDLSANKQVPAFGTCLEEHLRRTGREIASVIEECIITLWAFGRDEEGLFRIAGAASKVKKLKAAFDAGLVEMEDFLTDIHCVAGALKLYLRELPEPLMTFDLYDEWMAAAHLGHEERMLQLWLLCDKLPKPFANNLRYLIKFLAKLSENSEVNKMSPSNIAIVIAPNLIWPKGDSGPSVLSTTTQSGIVESLIQHADYFFPGDIEFDCGGPSSEKGTPPGTLSAPPAGLYQNLDDLSTAAAPSLSPSASDHNFNTNDSPRTLRKNKRAAPAPPGIKPTRATVPTPLSTADTRPAVNEKPSHLLQSQKSAGLAPGERSPHGPDRPSAPPPAPPKGIGFSPGPPAHSVSYDATQGTHDPMAQAGAVHNQLQGSSKPSIPCSPKPTSAASRFSHDVTPSGVKPDEAPAHFEAGLPSQGATHSAAYDNMGSLTYGTKPAVISDSDQSRPMACNTPSSPNTGAVFSTTNSTHTSTTGAGPSSVNTQVGPDVSAINDKHEKSNSLPRTLPKPPRPPRPVTMIGKEGSDIISGSGGERKPSATEDTRL